MTGSNHSHHHAPANYNKAFFIGILLNTLFVIAEIIYGIQSNSIALIADAVHNVSDVFSLLLAWGATIAAKRKPSQRFTYGFKSTTIAAAFINALVLFIAVGAIGLEAIHRISTPTPIASYTVMIVASIGVLINGTSALFFMAGRKNDLNIRGAFLHLVTDAAVSLSVVVSSVIILITSWFWFDPLISLLISVVTILGTWGLFKESGNLLLQAVPAHIDTNKVNEYLTQLPGVTKVHDLHIWALSTTEVALSVHLLVQEDHPNDEFLKTIHAEMISRFQIHHVTVQIENQDLSDFCTKCD